MLRTPAHTTAAGGRSGRGATPGGRTASPAVLLVGVVRVEGGLAASCRERLPLLLLLRLLLLLLSLMSLKRKRRRRRWIRRPSSRTVKRPLRLPLRLLGIRRWTLLVAVSLPALTGTFSRPRLSPSPKAAAAAKTSSACSPADALEPTPPAVRSAATADAPVVAVVCKDRRRGNEGPGWLLRGRRLREARCGGRAGGIGRWSAVRIRRLSGRLLLVGSVRTLLLMRRVALRSSRGAEAGKRRRWHRGWVEARWPGLRGAPVGAAVRPVRRTDVRRLLIRTDGRSGRQ